MATLEEQKAIYQILVYLREGGIKEIRRGEERGRSGSTMRAIRFSEADEKHISSSMLYGGRKGSLDKRHLVPIIPPSKEKDAVAALWYEWDFTQDEKPDVGYYVGLWNPVTLESNNQAKAGVRFVGYRYESPEKKGDDHKYYHSQPCRSMGAKSDEIEEALPISHRAPTWPLPARCPVELLLCVLLSLYGMNGLKAFDKWVLENSTARQIVKLRNALNHLTAIEF